MSQWQDIAAPNTTGQKVAGTKHTYRIVDESNPRDGWIAAHADSFKELQP